jgi:lipoprotein-anchoring transpeptidase ErfK/SrfK
MDHEKLMDWTRRHFLTALAVSLGGTSAVAAPSDYSALGHLYGAMPDDRFPVPAIDLKRIKPEYLRREVDYKTLEPPGTIIVDPANHFLYHVGADGRSMRYGVGVGKQGFAWSGDATINSKQAWPDWYPPKEMLERQPSLMHQMSRLRSGIGMAGGPRNPLGARALYLWQDNRDTLYRIHGTVEPWSIGTNASSGCIRMINQDVMHLYERVAVGSRVVVLGTAGSGYIARQDGLPNLHSIVRDPDRLLERGLY